MDQLRGARVSRSVRLPVRLSWLGVYMTLALAAMAVAFAGCGSSKVNAISTGSGGGGGTNVICTVTGNACSSDGQCCSHDCDPVAHTCGSSVSTCSGAGSSCAVATDCCNLQCDTAKHVCSTAAACTADGASCSSSSVCCSGNCSGGTCQALNATCKTAGNPCSAAGDCCSGFCTGGTCALGASFCIQPGDACARDTDCCGGSCAIAAGATLGTCQDVATTGTGSCMHDGVLCNGCGNCCSKNCGPWALTGVNVCQPGLGCKILNSLCTTTAECCGGAGTSPEVSCVPATSASGNMTIGVCAQNHGNQVPGGICKLSGNANACGNAESDCECALDPKAQCCAYDTLGLPRCLGSGTCSDGSTGVFSGTDPKCCRPAGQTCNTAAECCGLSPCVPDSTGVRHCLNGTDGAIVCVKSGGTCTATGDCCTGLVCNITPSAAAGKCGAPPTATPPDAGVCALYGQACNAGTPCCNNVQCTYSPKNAACGPTDTGCTCYNPITIGFQGGTP